MTFCPDLSSPVLSCPGIAILLSLQSQEGNICIVHGQGVWSEETVCSDGGSHQQYKERVCAVRRNRVCNAKRVISVGKGFALPEGTHTVCAVSRERVRSTRRVTSAL